MDLAPYLEALRLIADLDAQRQYQERVPIANVPAELVCMWFDDLGFSDGVPAPGLPAEILAFTTFYDARVCDLPDSGGLEALHRSSKWREVVEEARRTLVVLERKL